MTKNVFEKISELERKYCLDCEMFNVISRKQSPKRAYAFCMDICTHGEKIKELGNELQYGQLTKKAIDLTKDEYVELIKKYSDKEICKIFDISQSTLERRKSYWKVKRREKTTKFNQHSKKEYFELKFEGLIDQEIAKKWGIGEKTTLWRWKKKWGLRHEPKR